MWLKKDTALMVSYHLLCSALEEDISKKEEPWKDVYYKFSWVPGRNRKSEQTPLLLFLTDFHTFILCRISKPWKSLSKTWESTRSCYKGCREYHWHNLPIGRLDLDINTSYRIYSHFNGTGLKTQHNIFPELTKGWSEPHLQFVSCYLHW